MTIKDIAKEAGYAVGTVSRVLNNQPGVSDEARKKVMEVVEKYHFRLNTNAKHLKQQNNTGIALIVKGRSNILFAGFVERFQKLIEAKGYASVLYYIDEEEHEVELAMQICRERQPLGILFLGSNQENLKESFSKVDIPCVLVTNPAAGLGFENLSSVCIDDTHAAKTAIEFLISKGHEKIGIIGGEMSFSNPAKARYEGCLQAFKDKDIHFDPENQLATASFTLEGGYRAMKQLIQNMPEITAVFAMSDVTALGAIRAAKDCGRRIPEDMSVVGYDGIEMGQYVIPKLTTIKQPGEDIAYRCVEILMDCIHRNGKAVREIIPFSLIEGESTQVLSK